MQDLVLFDALQVPSIQVGHCPRCQLAAAQNKLRPQLRMPMMVGSWGFSPMYCKGFIKGFNHGFQYCSNAMGSSCLLNGTCQRNNNETGFKEETRSICVVFCEVEPNEHVSEPGGIEGPSKLPARFGGPILGYQLQRTLTLPRGKAAALLKNNSCTSYGFMEQAASVPCCRWDPCQSSNPCPLPRMPC